MHFVICDFITPRINEDFYTEQFFNSLSSKYTKENKMALTNAYKLLYRANHTTSRLILKFKAKNDWKIDYSKIIYILLTDYINYNIDLNNQSPSYGYEPDLNYAYNDMYLVPQFLQSDVEKLRFLASITNTMLSIKAFNNYTY